MYVYTVCVYTYIYMYSFSYSFPKLGLLDVWGSNTGLSRQLSS